MSKRAAVAKQTFKRRAKDFYATTDVEALRPLLPHLRPRTRYIEPCAGAGDLIKLLSVEGHICIGRCDVAPKAFGIAKVDMLSPRARSRFMAAFPPDAVFITNPPWKREWLHPLITALSDLRPTWLLFDADWAQTVQAKPFENRLRKVVTVGRVRWIPGSKSKGFDNCAWYLFDKPSDTERATFHMREAA